MTRFIFTTCIATFCLCAFAQAAPPEASLPDKHQAFLKTICLDCHDADTQEGKVDLEALPLQITTLEQAELWQKVLNAVNAGEMPPEDSPQPGNIAKADFLEDLAQTMVAARKALSDSGGKITMRRLNRREYRNTIQHLTGIQVEVDSLPADGGAGSYDTTGASQFISSDQFLQYLKIGRIAIDEVFQRQAAMQQESRTFRVEPETTVNVESVKAMRKLEETYERFMRWKAGVDKAAAAPENKAIVAGILKQNPKLDLSAWPSASAFLFYRHASELIGAPDPTKFGFRDDNDATFSFQGGYSRKHAYIKHYAQLPHSDRGTYLKLAWGIQRIDVTPKPKNLPPGTYTLRIRAGAVEGSPSSRRFIEIGHPQRVNGVLAGFSSLPISSHQVTGTIANPEIIETQVEIGIDTPREFGIQERQPNDRKNVRDAFNKAKRSNGYGIEPAIWIDWVELKGPHWTEAKTWKQRRQVEAHANAKVGGTYNGYYKGGFEKATRFLETGKPHKGITDEQEAKFRIRAFKENGPTFRRYLEDPLTQSGSYLTIGNLNKEEFIALPPEQPSGWRKTKHVVEELPAGDYRLRLRIGAVKGTPAERHFVDIGSVPQKNQFNHLATFQVTGSTDAPQTIEVPVSLTNDGPRKFAVREKRDPTGDLARYRATRAKTGFGPPPALWIDWVEWEGPLSPSESKTDSPLHQIIAKHSRSGSRQDFRRPNSRQPKKVETLDELRYADNEQERARVFLNEFALAAFRQTKPDAAFIDKLVAIFETRRRAGDAFDVAIRTPLSVILASPGFLYLNEPVNESDRRQLDDRELAVRLSYFLWSSPPDQELLNLAAKNQLHQPSVLRQQVDRLIADRRSDEFVSGFVHQWLDMERLDFFQFDVTLHPDFDESTRSACRTEVYQSFAHLLRDQATGRLGKLLKSDYVFINGLLATYYGIDGVTGDEFRQVKLPAGSPRGGLLGMAAIHAMGSDGVVSSPVERGAWVLRHLLNDPPPPAPPNVPQISRLEGQILTTRERLLAHQEEAQCASCHRKIDPIGFGLENFGAAGKWRTEDSYRLRNKKGKFSGKAKTWPIDPSGAFHNGPAFSDYEELRDRIVAREGDFARGFTEHLIEYALGRPFGFTDEDLASEMVRSASTKQFAVSEFIHTLVQSKMFRTVTGAAR